MAFERVGRVSEISPGSGVRVVVAGREIGIFRAEDRLYAMENLCPHAGSSLHEGFLTGTRVVCPGHGWEFDLVTGLAPGEEEEEPLIRYPLRVEGEEVWVDADAPILRGCAEGAPVG